MLPWQETAVKLAASALLLAVLLPLIGFAFTPSEATLRSLRVGAVALVLIALLAGAAALVGWVWR
jgi:hypothetical protein